MMHGRRGVKTHGRTGIDPSMTDLLHNVSSPLNVHRATLRGVANVRSLHCKLEHSGVVPFEHRCPAAASRDHFLQRADEREVSLEVRRENEVDDERPGIAVTAPYGESESGRAQEQTERRVRRERRSAREARVFGPLTI